MSFKASSPVTRCFVLEWFLRYIIIFFCTSCLSCFADKVASLVILSKKQQKFFTIRPKNVIPRICLERIFHSENNRIEDREYIPAIHA